MTDIRSGAQGQDLETDSVADSMNECCLLACSPCFIIQLRKAIVDWTFPQRSATKKPHRSASGPVCGSIFSTEVPSSRRQMSSQHNCLLSLSRYASRLRAEFLPPWSRQLLSPDIVSHSAHPQVCLQEQSLAKFLPCCSMPLQIIRLLSSA